MALITIHDLPHSTDLDRKAMQAIAGGSRNGARPPVELAGAARRGARIVDYPPGFGRRDETPAGGRGGTPAT